MNDEIRGCYRTLEVEEGASLEAVKGAYHELLKVWHPDRFPNDPKFQKRATEKTKALNDAFQKISAYHAGTYTESRASARAAYEQARKAREATEAREREEAARRAREAAEAKAREEARLEEQRRRSSRTPEPATRQKPPQKLSPRQRDILKWAFQIAVFVPLFSWWQFGDCRYLLWSDTERTVFNAEKGHAWAQSKLGWMYDNGQGVPQNYNEAFNWYSKAAKQGDAMAQNNLGVMYNNGEAVQRDEVQAYKWYCLSAAQGNTNAINNRDSLLRSLTPQQIAEGQRQAANPRPNPKSVASAEFEREFFERYPHLKPYASLVDAVALQLQASGYRGESREAIMERYALEAGKEILRQRQPAQ